MIITIKLISGDEFTYEDCNAFFFTREYDNRINIHRNRKRIAEHIMTDVAEVEIYQ